MLGFHHQKKEQDLPEQQQLKQEDPAKLQDAEQATATKQEQGGYKFQLLADGDFSIKNLKVGHAWVRLIDPHGKEQSWGFWPAHPLNPLLAWKSVQGAVHSPDTAHSPTAMHHFDINAGQAAQVQKAAAARIANPGEYNLFTRNCVDFAANLADAGGVPMPSFSTLGVANPERLAQSIEQMNAKEGEDSMERPLPPSKFENPNQKP